MNSMIPMVIQHYVLEEISDEKIRRPVFDPRSGVNYNTDSSESTATELDETSIENNINMGNDTLELINANYRQGSWLKPCMCKKKCNENNQINRQKIFNQF